MKIKESIREMFAEENEIWISEVEEWVSMKDFILRVKDSLDWGRQNECPYIAAIKRHEFNKELNDSIGDEGLTEVEERAAQNTETHGTQDTQGLTAGDIEFLDIVRNYRNSNPLCRLGDKDSAQYLLLWKSIVESKETGEYAKSIYTRLSGIDLSKQAFHKKKGILEKILNSTKAIRG